MPRRQQGVALLVAMVVLVIIGVMSASIMRGALSSDLVANNARVQTLAAQAAQIALRYCEDETRQPVPDITLVPAGVPAFSVYANWSDDAMVNTVPEELLESADSTFTPSTLPQCMAQILDMGGGMTAYQVTARGFSPDYSVDDDGFTSTGSVVWLQSTLSLN